MPVGCQRMHYSDVHTRCCSLPLSHQLHRLILGGFSHVEALAIQFYRLGPNIGRKELTYMLQMFGESGLKVLSLEQCTTIDDSMLAEGRDTIVGAAGYQ